MLRTIALYKLVKVLLLLLAAYGELHLHDRSLSTKLITWVQARPAGLEHQVVTQLLQWFSGLSESKIHALRIVTFSYAAVFAVEGIGLWMQKRWAEWLTTIITASLIPLEVWELTHRPNFGKAAVVIANAAIVAYLVWHVRSKGRRDTGGHGTAQAAAGPPPPGDCEPVHTSPTSPDGGTGPAREGIPRVERRGG
jgi:uncharacterized membrane protein (DUF2068 family)